MDITNLDTLMINLPKSDVAFLKSIAKRMGWTAKNATHKKTAYEQSMDDVKHGRITEYTNADELFKELDL